MKLLDIAIPFLLFAFTLAFMAFLFRDCLRHPDLP
jgi:hypothetical protein